MHSSSSTTTSTPSPPFRALKQLDHELSGSRSRRTDWTVQEQPISARGVSLRWLIQTFQPAVKRYADACAPQPSCIDRFFCCWPTNKVQDTTIPIIEVIDSAI